MDLKQLNNKEYLLSIVNNKDLLDSEITRTRGYVLAIMEEYKLLPDLEYLLEKENIFSFNFILKNYELEKPQLKKLQKYFSKDANNKVVNEVLTQEEIEQYLKEGKLLNKNTILTPETLNNYVEEIDVQYDLDEYHMVSVMKKSVRNLTTKEFLSLNPAFLKRNVYAFNDRRDDFSNPEFSKMYKEFKMENAKESKASLRLDDFRYYIFTEEDKDLLDIVLKTHIDRYSADSYSEIKKLNGASDLISEVEYFQKYNVRHIRDFSDKKIEKNKSIIQKTWLEYINSEKRTYRGDLDELIRMECTIDQFKIIVDDEYFEKLVDRKDNHLSFRYSSYRDDDESKKKIAHLDRLVMNYAIKYKDDEDVLNAISFSEIMRNLESAYEKISNSIHPERKEELDNITRQLYTDVIPKKLTTRYINDLLHTSSSYLMNHYTIDFLSILEEKPTINLLLVLLEKYNQINDKTKSHKNNTPKNLLDAINTVAKQLNSADVREACKYYEYPISKLIIYKNTAPNDYESNLLNYKSVSYDKLHDDTMHLLFAIKKDFRQYVLKENKELSISLLRRILNNTEDKEYFSFIKEYAKAHKEQLLGSEDFTKSILAHPLGKKILKIDNELKQNNEFEKWLNLTNEKNKMEVLAKKIKPVSSNDYYDEDEDEESNKEDKNKEYKDLTEKIESIREKASAYKKNFSFDFLQEKVKKSLLNKDFNQIKNILSIQSDHKEMVNNYIENLNFNDLLKNIDNDDFCQIIVSSVSYDKKSSIKLSKFNDQQNSIIAQLLLPVFENKDKVLSIFDANCLDFVNEFAVKNFPEEVFYGYDLKPNRSDGRNEKRSNKNTHYVYNTYTNEQILRAYNTLKKQKGFFCNTDVNARFADFFSSNFDKNEKSYLELLEIAKKEDPKLYVILAADNIFDSFYDKHQANFDSTDRKTYDQLAMEYFLKTFDFDIILKGIEGILEEIKSNYKHSYEAPKGEKAKEFNSKIAIQTINRILYNIQYDKDDVRGQRTYYSDLSEENTDKLIELFLNKAPLYLMDISHIAMRTNLAEHFETEFGTYFKNKELNVEDILYPDSKFEREGFNIKPFKKESRERNVDGIINGLITYYTENKNVDQLNYMSYLLQQHHFFQSELNEDYKYTKEINHPGYNGVVEYINEEKTIKERLLKITRKFFLEKALNKKEEVVVRKSNKI